MEPIDSWIKNQRSLFVSRTRPCNAFTRLRANNIRGAARAGRYRKLEAVQLYNRSDQAQTQPQPLGTPAFV
jgi:hypothetical protein